MSPLSPELQDRREDRPFALVMLLHNLRCNDL